jgi:hypothetical protein
MTIQSEPRVWQVHSVNLDHGTEHTRGPSPCSRIRGSAERQVEHRLQIQPQHSPVKRKMLIP